MFNQFLYWTVICLRFIACKQEGICDKNTAPSVSSISRVLRGSCKSSGYKSGTDSDVSIGDYAGRKDHTIDGILGGELAGYHWFDLLFRFVFSLNNVQ